MEANKKPLTLSIVIPVYNEERYIKKCLSAIKKQTVKPFEVIIVDNNCIDRTIEIAKKFDFVTIIKEEKQGIANARNKGFSVAKGDILGRIDADASITKNWVKACLKSFEDDSVSAITGPGVTSTTPIIRGKQVFPNIRTAYWSKIYLFAATGIMRVVVLWGANMAIRKDAWAVIKNQVCSDDKLVHEDQDISILLAGNGFKAKIIQGLDIYTDGSTYFFWPKFKEYMLRSFKTLNYHKKLGTLNNSKAILKPLILIYIAILVSIFPTLIFAIASFLFFIIPQQLFKVRLLLRSNISKIKGSQ